MTRTDRRCPRSTFVPAGADMPRRRLTDFDEPAFDAFLRSLLQDAERQRESQSSPAMALLEAGR